MRPSVSPSPRERKWRDRQHWRGYGWGSCPYAGRALPPLRHAVGTDGARRLPFADASADAIFAAGLVNHLPDAEAGLAELARVTRPGGRLVLYHPSGRAALAAWHGRTLSPGEPLSAAPLRRSTQATGWRLATYDDAADRFFAVAVRRFSREP